MHASMSSIVDYTLVYTCSVQYIFMFIISLTVMMQFSQYNIIAAPVHDDQTKQTLTLAKLGKKLYCI